MTVRVDKSWRNDPALRVDDSRASWHHLAPAPHHFFNEAPPNPYLTLEGRGAGAINDQTALHQRQRRGVAELLITRFSVERIGHGRH